MMRHLGPWIVGLLLLGVIGWEACQGSRSLAEWQADTTRTFQGVQAREDSAEKMLALARDLFEAAHQKDSTAEAKAKRADRQYRSALNLRDSLGALLTASPDTAISLQIALETIDSLEAGYRSLKDAFDLQGQALAQMDSVAWSHIKRAELYKESVDSLSSLVRRAPVGGCRILGVPCPVGVVGYGAVLSGGVVRAGPVVSVGWRVAF